MRRSWPTWPLGWPRAARWWCCCSTRWTRCIATIRLCASASGPSASICRSCCGWCWWACRRRTPRPPTPAPGTTSTRRWRWSRSTSTTRAFLIRSYNQNPYRYAPEAEQALIEAGDRKPFDTQWLCAESVRATLAAGRTSVLLADVELAIGTVVSERRRQYRTFWADLAPELQAELRAALDRGGMLAPERAGARRLRRAASRWHGAASARRLPAGQLVSALAARERRAVESVVRGQGDRGL